MALQGLRNLEFSGPGTAGKPPVMLVAVSSLGSGFFYGWASLETPNSPESPLFQQQFLEPSGPQEPYRPTFHFTNKETEAQEGESWEPRVPHSGGEGHAVASTGAGGKA